MQRLERDFLKRSAQVHLLLNATLGDPLAAGDSGRLQRALDEAFSSKSFDYLVAKTRNGEVTAVAGRDPPVEAPRFRASFDDAVIDGHYDTVLPVTSRGALVGFLHMGIPLRDELQAADERLRENAFRAVGAILFSILLFLGLIQPISRRVGRMQYAAVRIAAGDYDVRVQDTDPDDIGILARAFDRMAQIVRSRVNELNRALSELESAHQRQVVTADGLRAEQSRLISLLSAMNLGIVFVDHGGRVVYANPAFCEMWSLTLSQPVVGEDIFGVVGRAAATVMRPESFAARLGELLAERRSSSTLELTLVSGRMLKLQVCPVLEENAEFQGSVLIHEDITQSRAAEEHLAFLAERDPLTGLFNRRRFEHELSERLQSVECSGGRVALYLFDVDEFKSVNDLFGHRMGDAALRQIANEIRGQLRQDEFFARIGGDEFALIVDCADDQGINALAERVMQVTGGLSVNVGELRVSLTVSLGIAVSPDHAKDQQELIAHADAAMYQAKDGGKNTWRVFRADHSATLRQRSLVTWNDRIRRALRDDRFELHYQGVFGARDRKRRYSEALLRMTDETTGRLLAPLQFIPFAEKSNLIVDIDRWVIGAAIERLADCPDSEPIAVNISGRSFDEPTVVDYIADKLSSEGVAPSRLTVEITETAAIRDMREAQRFIERLHEIGCKVSLDDFGAGFASFAYIKLLPVDVLKIDALFVRDLAHSRDNQIFIKAMLDIARGFGKMTVAEGVDNEAALAVLVGQGVDMAQGFMLERPQPMAHPGRRSARQAPAIVLAATVDSEN